ncbi:putative 23S rRNA (guanosine-2 -o-)-methyltransferase rlmb protein [Rosellinia necatrix]|uniref:rRNA methyltransferase 1, mitochondrial n=1 Tax=Rosellinia necatrix TaxID=77044 RepID=A0A1S7UML1_ROSNE|nr:putative 23S rRNA (guanosine-2 -o-)-methyltransferase rlmb protein [Rosellinia necatrix]
MRFPTSSCLLCRRTVLLKPLLSVQRIAVIPSHPASSLSAIHHGLRQSEKSRPQGFKPSSLRVATPRRPVGNPRRDRGDDWTPRAPGGKFKIKRGKKDITYTGPKRPTRAARFNDPNSSFGKQSLVYQMKHGALKDRVATSESSWDAMENIDSSPGRNSGLKKPRWERTDNAGSTGSRRDFGTREPRRGRTDNPGSAGSRRDFGAREPRRERTDRPDFSRRDSGARESGWERAGNASPNLGLADSRRDSWRTRPSPRDGQERHSPSRSARWSSEPGRGGRPESFSKTRGFGNEPRMRTGPFPPKDQRQRAPIAESTLLGATPKPFVSTHEQPRDIRARDEQYAPSDYSTPFRVPHTTAASQFIYGRSVVEAALKSQRRQLYNLYIYHAQDRQNVSQDDSLAKLAGQKGVKVTILSNNGLRMMDKMSNGRPHNGYVLEASPAPQLPLKALGSLSEDPKTPGFHIDIAHQSREEADVNGTSDFVPYQLPNGRNPFVLLLDSILDPVNLGAILRTAVFLGVNAIAITKSGSATLTPVALKASAGASEVVTLFSVGSAVDFLTRSKENGWMVYAAVPSTKRSRGNSHLTIDRVETYDPLSSQPTMLVIGSEGEGLTKPIRRLADYEVSIPSPSGGFLNIIDSLNVNVATGILCSAFLKKQSSGMIDIEEDLSRPEEGLLGPEEDLTGPEEDLSRPEKDLSRPEEDPSQPEDDTKFKLW